MILTISDRSSMEISGGRISHTVKVFPLPARCTLIQTEIFVLHETTRTAARRASEWLRRAVCAKESQDYCDVEAPLTRTILLVQKCVCHGSMGKRRVRELTIGGLRPRQMAGESTLGLGGTVLRVPDERVWACRSNRSSRRPAGQMLLGLDFI
jgi:hypothetical protein